MPRPPLWLWLLVFAFGGIVVADDLRRDSELSETDALRARITHLERRVADGCFITRSPRVVAEARP